jgi:hypothetical protein
MKHNPYKSTRKKAVKDYKYYLKQHKEDKGNEPATIKPASYTK